MERLPILQMRYFLLVTIPVYMHERLAMTLQDNLTNRIVQTGVKGVLIEIYSREIVDCFMGRILNNIATMSRILDSETVVVGMQPAVAMVIVE